MQDSRTTEMLKRVQEVNNKIESGEINISDMKAEPLPLMNQEGNLSHVSHVRCMLIDFGIWLDKNDIVLENGNITENVDKFIKSINYI